MSGRFTVGGSRFTVGMGGAVLLWSMAAPALGQSEADRLFDEGVAAFEREDYRAALEAFEGSYALEPTPDALLNIGMCHRLVGHGAAAVNALRRYITEVGGTLPQEEVVAIRQQMDAIVPNVGQFELVVSEPGARLAVDGEEVGVSPLGWFVAVEPGEHSVGARKEGYEPAAVSGEVVAGGVITLTLVLTPIAVEPPVSVEPPPPPPVEPPPPAVQVAQPEGGEDGGGLGWWFWGSVIAAGTIGAGAAVTGGLTLDYADRYEDGGYVDADLYDTGIALRTTTDVLIGLASAAALSAILAVFLEDGGGEEPSPGGVSAVALPGGLALTW
jgi:hypothetical protein